MVKAVLIHREDSRYKDLPGVRYHFPALYLSRMEQTIGDWVIFYEPRANGGRMAYHSAQRVNAIIPDPSEDAHFYALLDTGSEISFVRPVPRVFEGYVFESRLRGPDGRATSGGYTQSAVRLLSDEDFDAILKHGFTSDPGVLGLEELPETVDGFAENQLQFQRPIIEQITSRPFRDAAFARQVKIAYENRCAITGLRILNGGGRPEVQAAHIRPVADNGPDTIRNGVALSGTVHWMFDRGLISIDDDYSILIAEDRVPADTVERLIVPERRLLLPDNPRALPHPAYLKYHREEIFKG